MCIVGQERWAPGCFTWAVGPGGTGRRPHLSLSQGALSAAFSTENGAPALLPYQFRMEEIEGFRYRCRVSGAPRGRETCGSSWTRGQAFAAEHPGQSGCLTLAVCPQDAMRSVTKQAIREARLKEIKEELLHSEKLKVRAVGGRERGALPRGRPR